MLINFRTENFRSLRDLNELSLIVPSGTDTRRDTIVSLPRQTSTRVGTVAGIFGPNASGKSNVLKAIESMRDAVIQSHQQWKPEGGAPQDPFLLDEEHRERPTLFEVDLLLDNRRFQYGFCLDKIGVTSEWLYEYPQNRRRLLFERRRGQEPDFRFGKSLTGPISTLRELTRPNSLFLSVGAANNHPRLGRIYRWFAHGVQTLAPDQMSYWAKLTSRVLADKDAAPLIRELLRVADLGIVDARVKRMDVDEEFESWIKELFERMPGAPRGERSNIEEAFELARQSVELDHEADGGERKVPISFDRESRGTQNWFSLMGALVSTFYQGALLLIDELDSSLHPYLSEEVLRMFHDPDENKKNAQLVFTSHDPTLLGNLLGEQTPLRRDEIWITEKDRSGATRLYSLTDFKPRKSENLERGYLQGRYGGVPFIDHERVRESVK